MTGTNVVAYRAAADTLLLYHLDEPADATTVVDSSGNGRDGTVAGATLGVDGRFGKAAQFTDSNQMKGCLLPVTITGGLT